MSSLLDKLYKKIDAQTPVSSGTRPKIGISTNRRDGLSCIAEPYFQSVMMAGGVPILLPVTTDIDTLTSIIEQLDGLILSGGGDIDPAYWGEKPVPEAGAPDIYRDEYDFIILRLAFNRQLPIFGICRGHQVINVAFGGTLYQDITTQYPKNTLNHSQEEPRHEATHTVAMKRRYSRLRKTFYFMQHNDRVRPSDSLKDIPVNSFHHQAIKKIAPEFHMTAVSPDGLCEAMEHPEYPIFSVQWHPESMAVTGNERMLSLFRYHIHLASVYAKAKNLHHRIATIDSHTDTPMRALSFDLGHKEGGKVNLPLMREGLLDAVFMVAYIPQNIRNRVTWNQATRYAEERLWKVIVQASNYPEWMKIAETPDDFWRIKQAGKKAVFLGIENGYAIGKNLNNLVKFKNLGVSYITLCHNENNDICDGVGGNAEWGGLSPFGKKVVAEMNRLGIMIDVSHAAESAFYDVLKYSKKPVIASHSSSRSICNHRRNLDDDQLKALAAKGGVVQLCLYGKFIHTDAKKASLSHFLQHFFHVYSLVGADHIGIGSDFDGDGELIGCRAANELISITMRLIDAGFDDERIAKIWGGNLLRVMREVQEGLK